MLLKILFIYFDYFAKDFEKNFQNICKTKQVVQAVSKILN
jgi:ribosomal protein S17E